MDDLMVLGSTTFHLGTPQIQIPSDPRVPSILPPRNSIAKDHEISRDPGACCAGPVPLKWMAWPRERSIFMFIILYKPGGAIHFHFE